MAAPFRRLGYRLLQNGPRASQVPGSLVSLQLATTSGAQCKVNQIRGSPRSQLGTSFSQSNFSSFFSKTITCCPTKVPPFRYILTTSKCCFISANVAHLKKAGYVSAKSNILLTKVPGGKQTYGRQSYNKKSKQFYEFMVKIWHSFWIRVETKLFDWFISGISGSIVVGLGVGIFSILEAFGVDVWKFEEKVQRHLNTKENKQALEMVEDLLI